MKQEVELNLDIITYALSKKYTDNSIAGGGALKGKNCIVSSIDPISGGHRVTFQWTLDNGTIQTDYVDVMDGQIGPQGIQGPQGVQGPRGLQGIQGIQGAAGAKGDKGDKGDTGNTGAKGADGAAASISIGTVVSGASPSVENAGTNQNAVLNFTLPKGDKGDKGDKGEDGADGKSFDIKAQFPTEAALRAAHPTGSAGDAYFVGADQNPDLYVWLTDDNDWFNNGKIAGVKGDKGDKGDEGFSPVASVSKTDSTVTISIRDKVGQTTATISDGEKGADGKSAYEVAVDNGYVGTEAEWLQSLIGQQGPQGIQGDPGIQGLQGPQGDPGTTNYNDLINKPTLGSAAEKDSTDNVRPNNRGLVESHAVYSAINSALSSVYQARGSITCAELIEDLLIPENVGAVYEVSDSGETSALFIQGAGTTINATDNVGIIRAGRDSIMFNYMGNSFDLSSKQDRDLSTPIEIDEVEYSTVEDTLNALNDSKVSEQLGYHCTYGTVQTGKKNRVEILSSVLSQTVEESTEIRNNLSALSNEYGAKNILEFPYQGGSSKTVGNVTFTVNSDGTVIIDSNGAPVPAGDISFCLRDKATLQGNFRLSIAKEYEFWGNAVGYPRNDQVFVKFIHYNNDDTIYSESEIHSFQDITTPNQGHGSMKYSLYIVPVEGEILDNVTIYPMIRYVDILDGTYVPYTKTNRELTQETTGLVNNIFANGAVNLLPNTATTQVFCGVTFTVNSDGTIQTSGTATSNDQFIVSRFYLPNGFYKLSGGINSDRPLALAHAKGDVDAVDYGNGVIFEADNSLQLAVYIGTKGNMSGLTYKPMITVADMPNSDYNHYVPHAKSNKELTKLVPSDASAYYKLITTKCKVYNNASDLENAIINLPVNSQFEFTVRSTTITVSGVTFPQYTTWHIYRDTNGIACIGGIGYSFFDGSCYKLNGSISNDTDLALTMQKLITENEFKSYGIKTIWTGSKTKGDTGMNFDASPYDLCFARVGGTWCRLTAGVGSGSTGRKKFTALYAGRDNTTNTPYEQYYLCDILANGTVATCGWFNVGSLNVQNARLAGQKALELAIAGTSTWADPTWKNLSDVETSVGISEIIGIKFQAKS